MAERVFSGGAPLKAQEITVLVSDTTNTNTLIMTLTDLNTNATEVETWTNGASETLATISTGVTALITASSKPLFQRLTATANTSSVNGLTDIKAKFDGEPFSLAITGTATTPTTTTITASSGPYDLMCAANYDGKVVPSSADHIVFTGGATVLYNLYQAGTTFGKISTSPDFSGTIGALGTPLQAGCTDVDIYGSGKVYLNVGSSAITPVVFGSATLVGNAPAVVINGSALTSVHIKGGSATIAPFQGETATCTTINVEAGRMFLGSGVTNTTLNITGGTVETWTSHTTINGVSGTLTTNGAGTVGTFTVTNANVTLNSTGTVTTLTIQGNGNVDATKNSQSRTFTNTNVYGAGQLNYLSGNVTFTNPVAGKVGGAMAMPPVD